MAKRNLTIYLDEHILNGLKGAHVDNISDLVGLLLKAWLVSIKGGGSLGIIESAILKANFINAIKKAYEEAIEEVIGK